jgi:hypothetical protein
MNPNLWPGIGLIIGSVVGIIASSLVQGSTAILTISGAAIGLIIGSTMRSRRTM